MYSNYYNAPGYANAYDSNQRSQPFYTQYQGSNYSSYSENDPQRSLPLSSTQFGNALWPSTGFPQYSQSNGDAPERIIAVMGATGTGKSSFISRLTGQDAVVGHNLTSQTQEIGMYKFRQGSDDILLVDTPGFDDTNRSDADVLESIARWMELSYREDAKLTGLIFLHRISDNRMGGSSLKNFKMFRKLCGDGCLRNVVLVTTMWDTVDRDVGESREQGLREKFWAPMIRLGSQVMRHDPQNPNSAATILSQFYNKPPVVLQIQDELVHRRMALDKTAAGEAVNAELAQLRQKYREERQAAEEEYRNALRNRDNEMAEFMRRQRDEADRSMRKVQEDQEGMARRHQEQMQLLMAQLEGQKSGGSFWKKALKIGGFLAGAWVTIHSFGTVPLIC